MTFGICTSLSIAPLALKAGFDYVECGAGEMTMMDPWNPSAYEGLRVESMNLFFAGHLDLYGSDEWRSYGATLSARAKEIGVQRLVVGSGALRKSREGSNIEETEAQFIKILQAIQSDNEITLYPESLNRSETDVFNDCATLARKTLEAGVGYTADSYHLLYEWDSNGREGGLPAPSAEFWESQMPHLPGHVHLAALEGRRAPRQDDPMISGFASRLIQLGYNDRISFECRYLNPESFTEALMDLQTYF
jgi:sugar phosphate isomerase/epimerase